jgi:hypothetical protein
MFAQIVAKCFGIFVAAYTATVIVIVAIALWSYKPAAPTHRIVVEPPSAIEQPPQSAPPRSIIQQ